MLFGKKNELNKVCSLGIRYVAVEIKQYHTRIYLACSLDEHLLGEPMVVKFSDKIKTRLRFIYS